MNLSRSSAQSRSSKIAAVVSAAAANLSGEFAYSAACGQRGLSSAGVVFRVLTSVIEHCHCNDQWQWSLAASFNQKGADLSAA